MKKLMFAAAVAAGLVAFGDGIESQNTVGYTTQDFMAKSTYYMMGSQFEATSGGSLKLSDFDFGPLTGAPYYDDNQAFKLTAPTVQIANADREGFATYYYLADGAANMVDPGWVDAGGNAADPTIAAGLGFWFYNNISDNPVLTSSGQVLGDAAVEKTFDDSYRTLVNPYPTAVKLSEITFENIAAQSPYYDDEQAFKSTAPSIQIPNADREGFATYYYLKDGAANMIDPGWVDAGGNAADPSIPVGRGCWFKQSAASMTVTFTR